MRVPSCSICFESLISFVEPNAKDSGNNNEGKEVSTTPCGHVFHTPCVSQWIQTHRHCPQCRTEVEEVGSLVKLFLAVEDGAQRRPEKLVSGERRFETFVVVSAEQHLQSQAAEEEEKIIRDVLQCQLDDLERESRQLRKQLRLTEDHLHEKVQEMSILESQLVSAKRKELQLEANVKELTSKCQEITTKLRRRHESGGAEKEELRRDLELLRHSNLEIKEKVQSKDADLELKSRRISDLELKLSSFESEIQVQTNMISQLQGQLEMNQRVDVQSLHSIYESVDEISTQDGYQSQRKQKRRHCLNFCKCLKDTLIISVVLVIILGAFVVLPLKLIFIDERKNDV